MLREGQRVAYTGPANEGLILGDHGRLLVLSSGSAHVSWETGTLIGQIVPVALYDLAPARSVMTVQSDLEDSLETAGLTMIASRAIYDTDGEVGIINAMAESGHLAAFQDIAEDALALVASRVRNDVSFREVLGQLDEDEGERVIRLAAACLIRDAFGSE